MLRRLSPKESAKRCPGPGAIRKVEWSPLAKKWLQDKKAILHTDPAKSYKTKVAGVLHTTRWSMRRSGSKSISGSGRPPPL